MPKERVLYKYWSTRLAARTLIHCKTFAKVGELSYLSASLLRGRFTFFYYFFFISLPPYEELRRAHNLLRKLIDGGKRLGVESGALWAWWTQLKEGLM